MLGKRKKEERQLRFKMNNKKILSIIAVLVAVASLTTLWVVTTPLGSPLERQGWERWNLTDEKRREIEQLIQDMRKNGASWQEIQAATRAKIREWGSNPPPSGDIELFYTVKTVVSVVNVALVIILLLNYIDIYRKTKSEFTIWLILFSLIMLIYAFASTPIVQMSFGFRAFGLGPFAMLPDLLACIALFIMLYLCLK